jgi:hypothetical protein
VEIEIPSLTESAPCLPKEKWEGTERDHFSTPGQSFKTGATSVFFTKSYPIKTDFPFRN